MRVLKIADLNHAFVGKSLFNSAELTVNDGRPDGEPDHIGLVGPNGCGKSTLLKFICGKAVPDGWTFEAGESLKIGYLDQYADIDKDLAAYEYLNSAFDGFYDMERRMNKIYDGIASMPEDEQLRAAGKAQRINDRLSESGFYRIDKKLDSVFSGLGFSEDDRDKKITQLSGGMKTKLILGKLLLSDHDLLLLDEPTNFLDAMYNEWLADYLVRLGRAYIVVSHDAAFLNKVAGTIIEIANRKLKVYRGNYDYYLKEKRRCEEVQLEQHIAQSKFIERSQSFVDAHYGKSDGGTKAVWLKKMLETLERIEKPDEVIKPRFVFRHAEGASKKVLSLRTAEVGYGGTPVLPPVTLEVGKGEKIVFQGFNGIGKTTLLKSIYGDLPLTGGTLEYGEGIESVFLRQEEDYENNFSHFDKNERRRLGVKGGRKRAITVIEFAKEYYPEKPQKELWAALLSCGLSETHFFNQVRTLSGGEMTKLRLCLAMLREVNLIILDEPTNHLDVYSKEVLMHALDEFRGAVIMTTHDRNADISWASRKINLEGLFD